MPHRRPNDSYCCWQQASESICQRGQYRACMEYADACTANAQAVLTADDNFWGVASEIDLCCTLVGRSSALAGRLILARISGFGVRRLAKT
jgi:hypothetical protein